MNALILFDFDGTLYCGDAPFRFYADVIAREMAPQDHDHYLHLVEQHLNGVPGVVAGDNWEAVVQLSSPFLPEDRYADLWNHAFLETRQYMLQDTCPLEVSSDLRRFLQEMQGRVTLACASNSPAEAAFPLLERLGLLSFFDHVTPSAGKPAGLISAAESLWGGPADPQLTASVGDNYRNDIAPALADGWFTAHISPHGYFPGPSTVHGHVIEEVLPSLYEWVARLIHS